MPGKSKARKHSKLASRIGSKHPPKPMRGIRQAAGNGSKHPPMPVTMKLSIRRAASGGNKQPPTPNMQ
eukprot:10724767-Alexandrium_andersonii.AAC.1